MTNMVFAYHKTCLGKMQKTETYKAATSLLPHPIPAEPKKRNH